MIQPRLGGYRTDPVDTDDYSFEDVAHVSGLTVPTGAGVDLRKWCSPIEDQQTLGSCVGNAVVGALELLQARFGVKRSDLSRMFVYYNSRLMHKEHDRDNGTYIRLAMGTLSGLGSCSETKWPYDVSKVFIRPTWGAYREAYASKIDSYYRISGTGQTRIDFVKLALESGCGVVFGCTVDDAFIKGTGSDGIVEMPKKTRINTGGHAMLIVGYDDTSRRLIVRNSWGTSWGDNGYCYMPYDYLDASDAHDLWVTTGLR